MKYCGWIFAMYLIFSASLIKAQDNQVKISDISQTDQTIEISITSTKQFYVGSRPYALHIGDEVFSMSKQYDTEDESRLTFFIPLEKYQNLEDKSEVTLVYGLHKIIRSAEPERETLPERIPGPSWELGRLDKSMLKN